MDEKRVRKAIAFFGRKIYELGELEEQTDGVLVHNIEYYLTAIEALEKQLPKKVENWNGQASCPRCKRLFGNMADIEMFCHWDSDCCNHCGQRLDWSEEYHDGKM